MLPAYVSYYLGIKSSPARLGRAIVGGLVCALGPLSVFSIIGLLASTVSSLVVAHISLLELIAGLFTFLMGLVLLAKLKLPTFPALATKAPVQKGFLGLFLYGILYGLATVSCSAPIFLSVLVYAVSSGPLWAFTSFILYAIGMGLPLVLITVAMAKAKEAHLAKIVFLSPTLQRLAGAVLLVVGTYIIYQYIS